jgi:hypothetical protein
MAKLFVSLSLSVFERQSRTGKWRGKAKIVVIKLAILKRTFVSRNNRFIPFHNTKIIEIQYYAKHNTIFFIVVGGGYYLF